MDAYCGIMLYCGCYTHLMIDAFCTGHKKDQLFEELYDLRTRKTTLDIHVSSVMRDLCVQ